MIYLPLSLRSNQTHWIFSHLETCLQSGFRHILWSNERWFLWPLDKSKTCRLNFLKLGQKEPGIFCWALLPNWFLRTKGDFQFRCHSKIKISVPSCRTCWQDPWWKVCSKDQCNCRTNWHLCQAQTPYIWYFRIVNFDFQRKKVPTQSAFHTWANPNTRNQQLCCTLDSWEFQAPCTQAFPRVKTYWFSFFWFSWKDQNL